MPRIDREKHESDVMEHVFGGVHPPERASKSFPVVETEATPGLLASTESSVEVDLLDRPTDSPTTDR